VCNEGTVPVRAPVFISLAIFLLVFISVDRYGTNGLEVVGVMLN
jgi:hypothetical protein